MTGLFFSALPLLISILTTSSWGAGECERIAKHSGNLPQKLEIEFMRRQSSPIWDCRKEILDALDAIEEAEEAKDAKQLREAIERLEALKPHVDLIASQVTKVNEKSQVHTLQGPKTHDDIADTSNYLQFPSQDKLNEMRKVLKDFQQTKDSEKRAEVEKIPDAYNDAGKYYIKSGKLEDAERVLNKSLVSSPNDPDALSMRSYVKMKHDDNKGALEDARKALAYDPRNKLAQAVAAFVQSKERPVGLKGPIRKPDFGALSQADPAAGFAFGSLGRASPKALAGTSVPGPTPAQVLQQKAIGKLALSDFTGALLDLRQALDLEPKNPKAWTLLAEISNKTGNFAGTIKAANEALRLDPHDAQALRARAYAQIQTGNYGAALEDANRAIQLDPQNGLGYLYRAMALEKVGNIAEALKDYETGVRLDPTLAPIADAAIKRLRGRKVPAAQSQSPQRLLLRGGMIALSLALVLYGLLGTTAGRRLTSTPRCWLTERFAQAAAVPSETLGSGEILGGTYKLVRELGRGGMGIVYEAIDLALQRRVAVKQLQRDLESTAEELERFLREARLSAKMKHPNLVEIYSVIAEEELYLVFEYVEGRTLGEVLRERGTLSAEEARSVLADLCSGLEYAHGQKIIHRDLKPSNIMVCMDGSCKIMDFGIAHQAQTMSKFTETATSGTPPYMAPEQAMGSVSKASDLYALGVMAYEMLTGELPFQGLDYLEQKLRAEYRPATVGNPSLPKGVDAFFRKALEPDPTKRPGRASEFLKAFEESCQPSRVT